jgi:hypothetical protein
MWGNVGQNLGGQKKGPVEDGSVWIHPKLTGGSLAAASSLRKGSENPREVGGAARGLLARFRGPERAVRPPARAGPGLTS